MPVNRCNISMIKFIYTELTRSCYIAYRFSLLLANFLANLITGLDNIVFSLTLASLIVPLTA